ncbi:MAG: PspA/IM30 family protein [Novosphingobium sp.]
MFEIAVRAKELASSNLNSLIDKASNPAKMLKLLMTELEESVIALTRDAAALERGADRSKLEAERFDAAALSWEDKAKLALSRDRDDLAKGALAERNAAREAAEAQRDAARAAQDEAAGLRASVRDLEAKHGETKIRLLKVVSETTAAGGRAAKAVKAHGKTEALMDRFASLEKRIDYAAAKTVTLDQELAALADEAALEADLAALRKKADRKKK